MGAIIAIIYIGIAAHYVRKIRPTAFTSTNMGKLVVDVLLTLGGVFTVVPILFCLHALRMLFGLGIGAIGVRSRR